MKNILTTLLMTVLCLCSAKAQTIQKGDQFFDGTFLYTVQEVRMGNIVYMVGRDTNGNEKEMTLEKVNGKTGEYTLQPSVQADEPPIANAEFGWRVQYVRKDGMNFLAVRKPNGDAMETLLLTPDNVEHCTEMQDKYEWELPENLVNNTLLNARFFGRNDRYNLKLLRNTILARHGYRFQSRELQDYFREKPWYKPGNDNSAIHLNIIEQTNVELIKSAEALPFGLLPSDESGDIDQSDED